MRGICAGIVLLCIFTASSDCFSLTPAAKLSLSLLQKHHRCHLPPSLASRCSTDWEPASVDVRQSVPVPLETSRFGLDRRALMGLGCGILSALPPGWGGMQQAVAVSLGDSDGTRGAGAEPAQRPQGGWARPALGGWELLPDGSVLGRLKRCGSSYCVSYLVDGSPFTAVVDTGSPFITITGSCSEQWGCYRGQGIASGLKPTYEMFAGSEGMVRWRTAEVSLPRPGGIGGMGRGGQAALLEPAATLMGGGGKGGGLVVGILSKDIEGNIGPGGVFLGLVKVRQSDIRPTFMGQAGFTSFCCDLRRQPGVDAAAAALSPSDASPISSQPTGIGKTLLLSKKPLIPPGSPGAIKLIDLRPYGDPVAHYACLVKRLRVNGIVTGGRGSTVPAEIASKPIFAIFDTGSTGLGISRDLYNALFQEQVSSETKSPWDQVEILVESEAGGKVEFAARRPLTFGIDVPWPKLDGHIVVLGLSFLDRGKLTIDVDDERLLLEQDEGAFAKGRRQSGWSY